MREIINELRNEAYHIKSMIGVTAPTDFNGTQKQFEQSQKDRYKQLFKAARILEATL